MLPDALAAALGWPPTSKLRWHRHWGYPREAARGWWLEDLTRRGYPAASRFFSDAALGVVTDDPEAALQAALQTRQGPQG